MAALFFDIDGTIIDSKTHRIPKSTVRSLINAKERGHLLFINTGRTACDLPEELEELPFDGYCCGCGTYISFRKQILFQSTISLKRGAEIVDCIKRLGIHAVLEGTEDIYFQKKAYGSSLIDEFRIHAAQRKIGITHTMEEPGLPFDKLIFFTRDKTALEKLTSFVDADFRVLGYGTDIYECIQKDHSKATAIERLRGYLQLEKEEIYVFGDSANDLDMFTSVKHAIAMGYHDSVLDLETEYITDTVENAGIQKALEHYGLISL